MKDNIRLGLILLLITAIAGVTLGAAHSITAAPIAATKAKAKQAAMIEILPNADKFEEVTGKSNDKILEVNAGYKNDEIVGYALKVAPKGYGGAVEIMVGISTDGTIGGIKILSHSETPGLGANAPKPEFSGQYANKSISESLQVVKGATSKDNEIQALTGATITSRAVTLGVNNAIDFYKSNLSDDSNASASDDSNKSTAKVIEANKIDDGYDIKVEGNGFGGPIEVIVTVSNAGEIKNIEVPSHNETPGLGSVATEPEFLSQFIDKATEVFNANGESSSTNNVEVITGATVSSVAITDAVNAAVLHYSSELKGAQN